MENFEKSSDNEFFLDSTDSESLPSSSSSSSNNGENQMSKDGQFRIPVSPSMRKYPFQKPTTSGLQGKSTSTETDPQNTTNKKVPTFELLSSSSSSSSSNSDGAGSSDGASLKKRQLSTDEHTICQRYLFYFYENSCFF